MKLAVIVASTREGRMGRRVADWFLGIARAREGLEIDVIDLLDTDLPGRLPAGHPARGGYPEQVLPYAARIGAAEAFVIVTPEYNHGYPGSLKDAIDLVNREWRAKPVGFVAYGGLSGGIRAIEQLRLVVAELHMVDIRDAVVIPFAGRAFHDTDAPADPEGIIADSVGTMLDRLEWWGRALSVARAGRPYDR